MGAGRAAWIQRVAAIVANGMRMNHSALEIAERIADANSASVRMKTNRERLIYEANGEPYCWVCGLRIFLDEPELSPAEFSIDHVHGRDPKTGHRNGSEVRAAHRLCNIVRQAPKLKPRTQRKVDRLRTYLLERMEVAS